MLRKSYILYVNVMSVIAFLGIYLLQFWQLKDSSVLFAQADDLYEDIESGQIFTKPGSNRKKLDINKFLKNSSPGSQTKSIGSYMDEPPRTQFVKEPNEPKKQYQKGSKGIMLHAEGEGKRYAIVIGINDYHDIGITGLTKARNDAKAVGEVLKNQGQFDQVFVMTDDLDAKDNLYPTKINIESKVDNIMEFATQDDMILFFFSGHGISDTYENGYLVVIDTLMDKPYYTSVKVSDVVQRFHDKKIKKSLLVLDACRDVVSSSRSAEKQGIRAEKYEKAEVAATFFSTKAGYFSFEDPNSNFGIFSKFLLYGMEGKADLDKDGVVTFSELERFVQEKVEDWSRETNKQQRPYTRLYGEKYGDLPITATDTTKSDSIVENNDYARPKDSKVPYVWRSALVPGWGQWYSGQKVKGSIYFATSLAAIGFFASRYSHFNSSQSEYRGALTVPGDMFFPTYMNMHSKRSELTSSGQEVRSAFFMAIGFYLWNVFDAGLLTKSKNLQEKVSVQFNYYKTPVYPVTGLAGVESRATFEISVRF